MEYIVLGQDNQEYGPVDGETLKKWVEHGRVFKDTKVRNSLMRKWNDAGTIDILQEAFERQEIIEEENGDVTNKIKGMLFGGKKKHELAPEREVNTAFKQKYIPNPATVGQRIGAFVIDAVILSLYGLVLFLIMNISAGTLGLGSFESGIAPKAGEETVNGDEIPDTADKSSVAEDKKADADAAVDSENDREDENALPAGEEKFVPTEEQMAVLNSKFNNYLILFVFGVLLYYGIGLGLFAQTYGMWFWGIIIVKGYNDEAFPARAFAFAVAMFLIGPLMPLVVLCNPQHRSLHGYLTGARLIRVAAKPKV